MSVTVVSLPVLLIYGVVAAATSAAGVIDNSIAAKKLQEQNKELHEKLKQSIEENDGCVNEGLLKELCKEYKTVFMDKDVLKKTLEEHGLNMNKADENYLEGLIENFTVTFSRENTSEPYTMKIFCNQEFTDTTMVNDLNTEYAMNVQEETYIKLKERLEQKKMEIESEEVLEDDSIMITINLD